MLADVAFFARKQVRRQEKSNGMQAHVMLILFLIIIILNENKR